MTDQTSNLETLLDNYRAALHIADVAPCAPNAEIAARRQVPIDTARRLIIEAFEKRAVELVAV